jgi:hypothetical protein
METPPHIPHRLLFFFNHRWLRAAGLWCYNGINMDLMEIGCKVVEWRGLLQVLLLQQLKLCVCWWWAGTLLMSFGRHWYLRSWTYGQSVSVLLLYCLNPVGCVVTSVIIIKCSGTMSTENQNLYTLVLMVHPCGWRRLRQAVNADVVSCSYGQP